MGEKTSYQNFVDRQTFGKLGAFGIHLWLDPSGVAARSDVTLSNAKDRAGRRGRLEVVGAGLGRKAEQAGDEGPALRHLVPESS